ncbi:MAG TPA: pitrilysin family protein [Gemmatimonadota bacterium]|nr:pitrilysin family protein [Gemmatimonadota bacterium]
MKHRIARRSATLALTALAAWLVPAPVHAQDAGGDAAGSIPYQAYRLDNGLQVMLSEDHSTPITAVDVWYHVGARNETRGRYGFAHLFEHMMFQGSAHVGKTEHLTRIEAVGGSVNGSTTEDRTNYYEVVPSDRVNLALWMEADRMRSLAVNQTNLENQQKTVSEELRQRIDNQPYATALLLSRYTSAYHGMDCPGYAHPPSGSIQDVEAATLGDVKAFHATYYQPNNATLTVVGDFDPEQVRGFIQDYFGGIPRASSPPAVACDVSYSPGFRMDTVEDSKANVPAVMWSYRVPPDSSADHYPLALLAVLFGQGQSSRLYRALVSDAGAALQASAGLDSRVGPGLLFGFALANQGVSPDSLLGLVQDQVARLKTDPPTEAELRKARNTFESNYVEGRQRVLSKAEALQHYALFRPDLSEVNQDLSRYEAVTVDDLKRVIDRYLTRDNLTVVFDVPPGTGGGDSGGGGGASGGDAAGGSAGPAKGGDR